MKHEFIHVSLSTIILDIFPTVFPVTSVNLLTGVNRDNEIKSMPSSFLKIVIIDSILLNIFSVKSYSDFVDPGH